MSQQKVLKPSKFAIVNAVVAALNLGDYGKVEGFVMKTAKSLERENETITRSIANAKHNLKTKLSGLEEELEDAQMAVEEAYTNLDPNDLKNNEAQRVHMSKYLTAIDTAEGYVLGLENKIKDAKEVSKDEIKELETQADVRKKRIARLTKGVVK
jgi:hypothetical protein